MMKSISWKEEYIKRQAFWMHDGNPKSPHALLTSGKHSSGFFNSRPVIKEDPLLASAARDLVAKLSGHGVDLSQIDCVVGPATGATRLAFWLSGEINSLLCRPFCAWASPEKGFVAGKKRMTFSRTHIFPYWRILLCDDVIITGSSLALTEKAIGEEDGLVLPFILTLVNRSGEERINGSRVVSLVSEHMPTWEADECPLCKLGSEAIRPKDNWDKLNGKY
jgi:orotate phosphoribosyltransferase